MKTEVNGWANASAQTYYFLTDPRITQRGGLFIWLTSDQDQAALIWRNLKFWSESVNSPLKAKLLLPENPDFAAALISFTKNQAGVYVLPFTYWNDLSVMSAAVGARATVLKVGDKMTPQKLRQLLVEQGYENSGEGLLGTFKQRGGSVSVFEASFPQGVKIELDEEKIIALKPLKSESDLNLLEIFPANLSPESLLEGIGSKLAKVDQKDALFIYQDPQILKSLSPEWEDLANDLAGRDKLVFHSFGREGQDLKFQAAKNYHKNFAAFLKDFEARQTAGWKIFLAVNEPPVLYNLFKSNQITVLPNTKVTLFEKDQAGFENERMQIWFMTAKEIFGWKEKDETSKKKRRRVDWGFFATLKPGEYVVHEDHGVARFSGLMKTIIHNEPRELFLLEYSEGDKLYVPVEQAHKIDKYIGQAHPTVHRLSSTNWSQVTIKVKEEARRLAQDLLKLYAQRQVVQIEPWQETVPEESELARKFPYKETPDQEKAIKEVIEDLEKPTPMDRLVVGDVGFGKTEVAIRAAFKAVMNHKQVAVLAPTTILVQQHFDTFKERLKSFGVSVEGLSRFTSILEGSKKEKEVVAGLQTGTVDVVIGTSRLLSSDIKFKNLGLIIIDEEQRFGVRHKEKLKELRTQAHILTMSATPIPRTLYFSLSGLRSVSTISTPPAGRKEIETLISEYSDELVVEVINKELKRGGQVYYLYNKVASIPFAVRRLKSLFGAKVRIGVVHGQLPEEEIAKAMSLFDNGQIDVLVCSSIIENGLDLPNVNTLIVEDATQFGLGQLYQLRGRIGRGLVQAHAYFLYRPEKMRGLAGERLRALQEAQKLGSGYQLALRDLEMRGVGNILGKEQHGYVAAVGLSTYLRLLDQAMTEAHDGLVIEPSEVKINLPLAFGISPELVPESEKRVQIYRRFALINDPAELKDEMDKFRSELNVKNFDQSSQNFFQLLRLKILAEQRGLKSIEYSEAIGMSGEAVGRLTLEFRGPIPQGLWSKLNKDGWLIDTKMAKIKLKEFGPREINYLLNLL